MKHFLSTILWMFYILSITSLFIGKSLQAQQLENQQANSGQFIEWTEMPVYASLISTAIDGPDGSWILGGQLNDFMGFYSPATVIRLSASGEKLWEIMPIGYSWEIGHTQAMTNCSDGNVLVAGFCMLGCDYGPSGIFVEKYAYDASVIWKQLFVKESFDAQIVDIIEHISGDIVVLTQNSIYKLDPLGDSIMSNNYNFNYNQGFACAYVDSLQMLFGYQDSLMLTDMNINTLTTHVFKGEIKDLHRNGMHYYVLSTDFLLKTDLNFQHLDSLDVSPFMFDSTLDLFHDSICLLITEDSIVEIDLATLSTSAKAYEKPEKFLPADMAISDTMLLLAGSSVFNRNKAFAAKTWSLNAATANPSTDIGITNIKIENPYAVKDMYGEDVYNFYWEAYATIKNYGSETINSCDIGTQLFAFNICGRLVYLDSFNQLSLAPGDSITVYLGNMSDYGYFLPGVEEFTYTLKLHSMIPNEKIDKNINNDESEVSFVIDLLDIPQQQSQNIHIYPNPGRDHISINPFMKMASWEIFSSNGMKLSTGKPQVKDFSIDISALPKGIYMLKLSTDSGKSFTDKFIVH